MQPYEQRSIDNAELVLPENSGIAFAQAQQAAWDAGLAVVVSEGRDLLRIGPDGEREFIKSLDPPVELELGQTYILRSDSRGE